MVGFYIPRCIADPNQGHKADTDSASPKVRSRMLIKVHRLRIKYNVFLFCVNFLEVNLEKSEVVYELPVPIFLFFFWKIHQNDVLPCVFGSA
jgi:hypothetical protein